MTLIIMSVHEKPYFGVKSVIVIIGLCCIAYAITNISILAKSIIIFAKIDILVKKYIFTNNREFDSNQNSRKI